MSDWYINKERQIFMNSGWKYNVEPCQYVYTHGLINYEIRYYSVSNPAYRSTRLIIINYYWLFINTGQSFKSHPNIHENGSHIAFSYMCFQTRQILVDLELKQDKKAVTWMNVKIREGTHYTRGSGCNKTSFISLPRKFPINTNTQ